MDLKKFLMNEYMDSTDIYKDTHREIVYYARKLDSLEEKLEKTLNEEQKKLFDKIMDVQCDYFGLKEELVAEFVWKNLKDFYKQLIF